MMFFLKVHNTIRAWVNRLYTILVCSSFGEFGKKSYIALPFRSGNTKDIFIGSNVCISGGAWIDCFREHAGKKWNPRLEIGDGTYIGNRSHIMVVGNMKIGRNVLVADKVYISDNLHGFEDINMPISAQPLKHAPVVIDDEVWLGENVCVLPGVTIGKHSVIGSNSVVTKDIPPYSVAVGSPAKIIRQYDEKTGRWESVRI